MEFFNRKIIAVILVIGLVMNVGFTTLAAEPDLELSDGEVTTEPVEESSALEEESQPEEQVDESQYPNIPDDVADLLRRQDQYESFTEEEKQKLKDHLGVELPMTEEEAQILEEQEALLALPVPDDIRAGQLMRRKDSLNECNPEEKELILNLLPAFTEVQVNALSQDYSLTDIYGLSLILEEQVFTLSEAQKVLELYSDLHERTNAVATVKSVIDYQPVVEKNGIKSVFLEGYSAQSIRNAVAVSHILDLELQEVLDSSNKAPEGKAMKATASSWSSVSRESGLKKSALEAAALEKGIDSDQLMEKVSEYYADPEFQKELTAAAGDGPIIVDYEKTLVAPFQVENSADESINLNTGALDISYPVVSLAGRGGLGVDLKLQYNNTNSELKNKDIGSNSHSVYAVVYDLLGWHYSGGYLSVRGEYYDQLGRSQTFSTLDAALAFAQEKNGKMEYHNLPSSEYYTNSSYETGSWSNKVEEWWVENPYQVIDHRETPGAAPATLPVSCGIISGSIPRVSTDCLDPGGKTSWTWPSDPGRIGWYNYSVWRANYAGTISTTVTQYALQYANMAVGTYDVYDSYNTTSEQTFNEKLYPLGSGWSWNLPHIQIENGQKYLHLADGREFQINSDNTLRDYPVQDLTFAASNGTFTENGETSAYVLTDKYGVKTYFTNAGLPIGVVDRFSNTIRYRYTASGGSKALSQIIDTAGRTISIAYATNAADKTVTVNAPDDTTTTLVLIPVTSGGSDYLLEKIIQPNNTEIQFDYSIDAAKFTYTSKSISGGTGNLWANLTQITYPTGAKRAYTYEKTIQNLGSQGVWETYRIATRKDVLGSGTDAADYNVKAYTYTNTYTGYPNQSNPQSLPSSYTYQTAITESDGLVSEYLFNNKHLNTETVVKAGERVFTRTSTEYDTKKLPVSISRKQYADTETGTYMEAIELYEYDAKGNVTAYWDPQANGSKISSEHKSTYTYDTMYNLLLTESYKQDSATTIQTTNTLTTDKKSIYKMEIRTNNIMCAKSEYTYDSYGNIVSEKKYLNSSKFTQTFYDYTDQIPNRDKPVNGVYLSKSKTTEVKDGDGNLVAGTPGFNNGEVVTQYFYDFMGRLISYMDANGNETIYEYDTMGEVTKLTNPNASTKSYTRNYIQNTMTVINELGLTLIYNYDGFGNELSVTDMSSNEILSVKEYDSKFRINMEQSYQDSTHYSKCEFTYDPLDRVLTERIRNNDDILLSETTYWYDDAVSSNMSRIRKVVTGDENAPSLRTAQYFDNIGRVVKESRFKDEWVTEYANDYSFDYVGNCIKEATAFTKSMDGEYTHRFTYDWAGRILTTTDALNNSILNVYDWCGNKIESTDAINQTTLYLYDALGRQIETKQPFADNQYSITNYYYDANGNLIKTLRSTGLPKSQIVTDTFDENTWDIFVDENFETRIVSKLLDGECPQFKVGDTIYFTIAESITPPNPIALELPYNTYIFLRYDGGAVLWLDGMKEYKVTITSQDETIKNYFYGYINDFTYNGSDMLTYSLQSNLEDSINFPSDTWKIEGTPEEHCLVSLLDSEESFNLRMDATYTFQVPEKIEQPSAYPIYLIFSDQYTIGLIENHGSEYTDYVGLLEPGIDYCFRLFKKEYETYYFAYLWKQSESSSFKQEVFTYDNCNRLILSQKSKCYVQYTYDAAGNILQMYTGLSSPLTIGVNSISGEDTDYSITNYEYDRYGRLIRQTDPLGQKETYTYDRVGNLLNKIDRTGNLIAYTYDALNRNLTQKIFNSQNTLIEECSNTYTLTGQIASTQNSVVELSYKYDSMSHIVKESETGEISKEYSYNLADQRTSYTLKKGGSVQSSTTYTYDELARLLTAAGDGVTVSYAYDANGNRISETRGNGIITNYTYNQANLVTRMTNKLGSSIQSSYDYTYYLDGNQKSKTDHTGRRTDYTYDGAGRLINETETDDAERPVFSVAYVYDDYGNRSSMTVSGAENYMTIYTYDLNNRLLSEAKTQDGATVTTAYGYDANGNQIQTASTAEGTTATNTFIYDGFDRLISSNVGGVTTQYAYRPDGLRYTKGSTRFIWDGTSISAEMDGDDSVTTNYIRGLNFIAAVDREDNLTYYEYNAHGDVVQLSDSDGAVTWNYDYDAFGNEREIPGQSGPDGNPFRYCGEYFDEETGTYYLRARYYNPGIGRFTQQDTVVYNTIKLANGQEIIDPLSLNRYTYCYNDPIIYRDTTGKSPELVQESLTLAKELVLVDGPLPVGDLIAAGVLVFAGGVWLWDNKDAIWNGIQWTGRTIGGLFMSKSDRVGWDVNSNTKNHILNGTKGSHQNGWKKFGIDPNDPNSFGTLLPFLKEAVDRGKETITKVNGGRILEYVYTIKTKSFDIWVRVFEFPNGTRILTDAAEYVPK